jgi:hypothetical protein
VFLTKKKLVGRKQTKPSQPNKLVSLFAYTNGKAERKSNFLLMQMQPQQAALFQAYLQQYRMQQQASQPAPMYTPSPSTPFNGSLATSTGTLAATSGALAASPPSHAASNAAHAAG